MTSVPRSWQQLFWGFLTNRPHLAAGLLLAVVVGAAAEVAYPLMLQRGVDAATGEAAEWSLEAAALGMLVVIVLIVVSHAAALVLETWLFSGASFTLRRTLYAQVQRLPFSELSRHRTGALSYRATSDVAAFEAGLTELFSGCTFDVLVGAGVAVAMALTDARLTAVVVAIMVVSIVVSGRVGRPLPVLKRATQTHGARLAGMLQESLAASRTVRAYGAEGRVVARLDDVNQSLLATDRRAGLRRAIVTPLWHFAEALGVVIVLWYGGQLVVGGAITIGKMIAFIAFMELLAGPINRLGDYYYQFQATRGLGRRIVDLLGATAEQVPLGTRRGAGTEIEVSHLRFRYPGTERWILKDLCFTAEPGECVALVGQNGAGKSTLFDLLLRFYLPDSGTIIVGGVELADWNAGALREIVGFMPQETMLFHGTLAENVAFGRPGAGRDEIRRALEAAGGGPLVERLRRGLDTLIGERGQGLSGGERQVVGLARLFLRDPRIVLLDEPTSQLDGESLRVVDAALGRLVHGRTTLLITHTPGTLRLASRLIVMDRGRVVAQGTHTDLLARHPLYRRLVGSTNGRQRIPGEPVGSATVGRADA